MYICTLHSEITNTVILLQMHATFQGYQYSLQLNHYGQNPAPVRQPHHLISPRLSTDEENDGLEPSADRVVFS